MRRGASPAADGTRSAQLAGPRGSSARWYTHDAPLGLRRAVSPQAAARYGCPRQLSRQSSTPSRRATPTIAFFPLPVLATSRRYTALAASSQATHLQDASTSAVRSRALEDRISPPSRRVSPLWRTIGASPAIFHLAGVVESLGLRQLQPEG